MKNQNIDINALLKPIGNGLRRFHTTLFIVMLAIGLVIAVLLLRNIISNASAGIGSSTSNGTNAFDTSTAERLKEFHTSDQALTPVQLPSGRINPFSE